MFTLVERNFRFAESGFGHASHDLLLCLTFIFPSNT